MKAGRLEFSHTKTGGYSCALGLGAVQALAEEPRVLAAPTVVVVLFMVALEQYTLAVTVRSTLTPLAAFACATTCWRQVKRVSCAFSSV
jgi:hypothetical protein